MWLHDKFKQTASAKTMSERPDIEDFQTGDAFSNWYWLKEELVVFCREHKIPYTGSKEAVTKRIAHWIDTGEFPAPVRRSAKLSSFDWHKAELTLQTEITDSYKNTQNVRRFMKQHYGEGFAFNIVFMDWMKANIGKTLGDAIVARREITTRGKTEQSEIPSSNQYNRYTRDFFAANPNLTQSDARACWAYKRGREGHNCYEEADLIAIKGRD